MNYRTLFFELLSNFREYHFDTFQLLLFDNNEENNILKVINNKEVETFLRKIDKEKEKVEKLLKLEEQRFEWLSDKLLSGEYIIED